MSPGDWAPSLSVESHLALCTGGADVCANLPASDRRLTAMDAVAQRGDRAIYRSRTPTSGDLQAVQTILVYDGPTATRTTALRTVELQRR